VFSALFVVEEFLTTDFRHVVIQVFSLGNVFSDGILIGLFALRMA
jgi:hypothetical protein